MLIIHRNFPHSLLLDEALARLADGDPLEVRFEHVPNNGVTIVYDVRCAGNREQAEALHADVVLLAEMASEMPKAKDQ